MTPDTNNVTPTTQRATGNTPQDLENLLNELERGVTAGRCSLTFALAKAALAGIEAARPAAPIDLREAIRSWNEGECRGLAARAQLTDAGLLRYTGAAWVPTEEGARLGLTLEGLGKTLGAHRGLPSAAEGGAQ